MGSAFDAVAFGIFAALSWGSADFIGGFLTRRFSNLVVVFGIEAFGIVLMFAAALLTGEPLASLRDLAISGLAGVIGMVAILTFFQGMSIFQIGLFVPLTAVMSAGLPVVFGIALDGLPGALQGGGLALALIAIWIISGGESESAVVQPEKTGQMIRYALVAGSGFGLFFLVMGQVTPGAVFWPVVAARGASLALIGGYLVIRGSDGRKERMQLSARMLLVLMVGGLLDAGGNVFYLLANQAGRLDISAVLSSLYPAATVFLAWLVLRERLSRRQFFGVAAAMAAVAMIAF